MTRHPTAQELREAAAGQLDAHLALRYQGLREES